MPDDPRPAAEALAYLLDTLSNDMIGRWAAGAVPSTMPAEKMVIRLRSLTTEQRAALVAAILDGHEARGARAAAQPAPSGLHFHDINGSAIWFEGVGGKPVGGPADD